MRVWQLIVVPLALAASAAGQEPVPGEADLERFRREERALAAAAERLGGQHDSVLAELSALTAARDRATLEAAEAGRDLASAEAQAATARRQSTAAGVEDRRRLEALASRLRALQRQGQVAGLASMISAPEPAAALAAARTLADGVRLNRILAAAARTAHEESLRRSREIESRHRDLFAARQRSLQLEIQMIEAVAVQSRRLTAIRSRETLYRQAAEEMGRVAGELDEFISGRRQQTPRGPESQALKGTLAWPAPGRIVAPFGPRRHPRFGTEVPHDGIDIGAAAGTPVRSVLAGEVLYADWFQSYGRTVIIDHGSGVITVSAYLSRIDVESGAWVPLGDVLGEVGDSGTLDGPRLYFEVRQDGVPQNPTGWLAPRGNL